MEKSNISQSDLLDVLTLERDNAIEAFRVACKKLHETDEDPNDEFNTTLDALAVAQLALKAEWVRQLRQLARMSPPTEARH
jgi:hypothetical protein